MLDICIFSPRKLTMAFPLDSDHRLYLPHKRNSASRCISACTRRPNMNSLTLHEAHSPLFSWSAQVIQARRYGYSAERATPSPS